MILSVIRLVVDYLLVFCLGFVITSLTLTFSPAMKGVKGLVLGGKKEEKGKKSSPKKGKGVNTKESVVRLMKVGMALERDLGPAEGKAEAKGGAAVAVQEGVEDDLLGDDTESKYNIDTGSDLAAFFKARTEEKDSSRMADEAVAREAYDYQDRRGSFRTASGTEEYMQRRRSRKAMEVLGADPRFGEQEGFPPEGDDGEGFDFDDMDGYNDY